MDRHAENVHQKLVLDPILTLANNPKQPLHAGNYFKNFKNILKEDYQKVLNKLTLFFLSNPVPFNEESYQTQKGPGTSDQSLSSCKTNSDNSKQVPSLVIYYLTNFNDII